MIIPFPSWRVDRLRRVLVAAVDDDLAGTLSPLPVPIDSDVFIRYVRASEAGREGLDPDIWVSRPVPSAPGRRVLFETLASEVVEQAECGTIHIDGAQLDGGPLLRVGSAEHDREGPIVEGESAALLLVSRIGPSVQFRVTLTRPVLWVYEQPRLLIDTPVLIGWTGAAKSLWRERSEGGADGQCRRLGSAFDASDL